MPAVIAFIETSPARVAMCRFTELCERQELNLHTFRYWILSPAIALRNVKHGQRLRSEVLGKVPVLVPSRLPLPFHFAAPMRKSIDSGGTPPNRHSDSLDAIEVR